MNPRLKRSVDLTRFLPEIAIVLLLALLTLNRLGAADVCGGSEAAMAVYVQQMIEHKQLLFPLDNCTIPMYKPPLYHWTATALAFLFRQQTATSFLLRLPSAAYAIGGAILTMVFARNVMNRRAAILAGLILCGSYQYISQARIGLVDMTLTFFETLVLYAFFGWFTLAGKDTAARWRRTFLHYICATAMGLAVLAKGPVGSIVPGLAIVIFLLWEKSWAALRELFKAGPLVTGAVIGSSWYLACLVGHRFDFLSLQIGSENLGRFFGSLGTMAPWYYLQPLLLNSLPLSLFVPAAVISALRRGRPTAALAVTTSASPTFLSTGALGARFLAIFWVCTVAFFEFASYKRRAYLLPLWPASALLLAWCLFDRIIPRLGRPAEILSHRAAVTLCLLLAAANFLFIPAYELHGCGAPFTFDALFRWPSAGFAGESSMESGQTESYRGASAEINRLTHFDRPLFVSGIRDALEPFVFYLDRCARPLRADTPHTVGYVIMTEKKWE
ncbi:MAG: glycosyltransferase family 39 protein, partial [Deltaproteobacteria bacterium]|nr:glycosyltransferase family 39 protein [Deltaproteobacteria bacterium]